MMRADSFKTINPYGKYFLRIKVVSRRKQIICGWRNTHNYMFCVRKEGKNMGRACLALEI